jgi:hypothetical protein
MMTELNTAPRSYETSQPCQRPDHGAHVCPFAASDEPTRERIRAIALARPGDLGEPGTRWSLTTLRRYLARHWVVSISEEHLRRVRPSIGITAQRTRTWKWSNDPLSEPKKSWVLAAYRAVEAGIQDQRLPPDPEPGGRRRSSRGRCCPCRGSLGPAMTVLD